ncbi:MAG: hypothetical protein K8R23_09430 [Chthoniobacter sp.]|nr:hypothetical protein [Chthoniobacter sp.]
MIIWSGLGILIPLITIAGVIVGMFLSAAIGFAGMGPGVGIALAALGNWGLWKLIYPKQPRILVDQATGQQVKVERSHSLFFIPARAWTWILAVLAVPAMGLGVFGERGAAKEAAKPGYKEFKAADALIDSKGKGPTHGNSETATSAAAVFSEQMKIMTAALFTGGSKKNLMTGGEFLTYCHESQDTIVFLCHVPSLRSYKSDEAKDGLNKVAWIVAQGAAGKLDPDHKKALLVGLRGITRYGSILQGKTSDEKLSGPASEETSIFYPIFASAEMTPPASGGNAVQETK